MRLSSILALKSLQAMDLGVGENVGTGSLTIPRNRFVKEHKRLVKTLRKGSEVEQQKEAREQWQELNKIKALGSDDYLQWGSSLSPLNRFHPPSLKNPQKVKQDLPTDGWHKGDSGKSKKQARQDLAEIVKRIRRQIGKPEVSRTASAPVFPEVDRWL